MTILTIVINCWLVVCKRTISGCKEDLILQESKTCLLFRHLKHKKKPLLQNSYLPEPSETLFFLRGAAERSNLNQLLILDELQNDACHQHSDDSVQVTAEYPETWNSPEDGGSGWYILGTSGAFSISISIRWKSSCFVLRHLGSNLPPRT